MLPFQRAYKGSESDQINGGNLLGCEIPFA